MFKHYLKTAFRNIVRQKGYSFISIASLAVGMACFILIMILVQDELSYDRFHENSGRIYRVITIDEKVEGNTEVALTPAPLAPALKQDFGEIIHASTFNCTAGGLVSYGDKNINEKFICFAEPDFFKIFSFSFIDGDRNSALNNPNNVVLTENTAHKYFGDENPLGKVLRFKKIGNLTVTGVLANPGKSHLMLNFILPKQLLGKVGLEVRYWNRLNYATYIMLAPDAEVEAVEAKLCDYLKNKKVMDSRMSLGLRLQPLTEIYLHSDFQYDVLAVTRDIDYIYTLSLLGMLILIIACINFTNLSTARAGSRRLEVGLRKTVGAVRKQLMAQFLGESMLLAVIAVFFALFIVEMNLPLLNRMAGKNLVSRDLVNISMSLQVMAVTIVAGLLAGSYPALYRSSFKPSSALKRTTSKTGGKRFLGKVLVVGQFSISIVLIIGAVSIYRQLHYMKNMKLGYDKDHLIYFTMPSEMRKDFGLFRNSVLQHPSVLRVSACLNVPNWKGGFTLLSEWDGHNGRTLDAHFTHVDYDYIDTLGLTIIQGRAFSTQYPSDLNTNIILNRQAVRQMGITDPVGKRMKISGERFHTIVGVVEDYNYHALHEPIKPLVLICLPQQARITFVRFKPGQSREALSVLKGTWERLYPDHPFSYHYLDKALDRLYQKEQRLGEAVMIFTLLAVLISCMGLFGLAFFALRSRTKEIGVRKALGASVSDIIWLLSRESLHLVLVSNIIAWPIAYFAISNWLQNFAYRIDVGIGGFVMGGFLAVIIALLTIGFHTIKAARSNPVDALKYE